MMNCKDLVLCKGLSGKNVSPEKYIQVFTAAGFNCKILSSLSFLFVNTDMLITSLKRTDAYSGFVFTSPRAVEAIHRAIKEDENLADFWKKCPAYCIGPSTESTAKNLLKLENCLGSNCGNSQDLAKLITQVHKKKNKPILYPCSAIARDTIQLILENEEITFEKIVSYDTLPSETLERDLLNIASDTEQIFIFFSPSIVKFIMTIAEKHNLIKNMKFVGIGDVTGEALKQFGVKIHGISEKPEPEALLQIIKNTTN